MTLLEAAVRANGGARLSKSQREILALGVENNGLRSIVTILLKRLGDKPQEILGVEMEIYANKPQRWAQLWPHKSYNGNIMVVPPVDQGEERSPLGPLLDDTTVVSRGTMVDDAVSGPSET